MRSLSSFKLCCRVQRASRAHSSIIRALSTLSSSEQRQGPEWDTQAAGVRLLPYLLGLGAAAVWLKDGCVQCDGRGAHNALTDVRIKVMRAWNDLVGDQDRLEASLPFHTPLPRARSPDIKLKDGRISVQFLVMSRASITDLLVDLIAQLGSQSSSKAVREGRMVIEVAECGAAQVVHLFRADGAGMSVQLHIPRHSSRHAEVEFLMDPEALLMDDDLEVIVSALRAGNCLLHQSQEGGRARVWSGSFHSGSDIEESLSQHFRAFLRDGLEGLDDHLSGALNELDRLFQPPTPGQELGEEEETEHRARLKAYQQLQQEEASTAAPAVDYGSSEANAAVQQLEKLGAVVYAPGNKDAVDWGLLAGYEEQKEQIEETLLLALLHPEVYNEVISKTRKHGGSNRPRAVLFEGPPGCGKTTSARVLATQASAPLVYVPIEAIASKWYGESERILGDIFKAAEKLDSCLVFLDEIDSLATRRSSEMHEATRRILGVLLRQLDGFQGKRSIVIGATNRRQDLDPALLSRFGTSIYFQLPSEACRQQILHQYAQHLSQTQLENLAEVCEGMSGRDLRGVCEQAERRTASKIIREKLPKGSLPDLAEYLEAASAQQRAKAGSTGMQAALTSLLPRKLG